MTKVLVLDNDHDIANVVKMVLDMNGYIGKCITNYKKLEETLTSFTPELLVLDIALGDGIDGRTLCSDIKATGIGKNLRIILFSANADASKDYKYYGADAFIAKPFDPFFLVSTIQNILAKG